MNSLTPAEQFQLIYLLEQEELEQVAPKLESFREPAPYKFCCGGRGAGGKSMGIASLLVQKMEAGEIDKWLCGREIQETLEESSFNLVWETVQRLRYKGWRAVPSSSKIINEKTGGYFKFAGFKDIKTTKGRKSLQGYDGCWVEECEDISEEIWDIILPTFRKDSAEIWGSFNRNKESDPVYKMFFVNKPPGCITIEFEPGKIDNPWFPDILQRQLKYDYETRPDVAEHKWGGKPRAQGDDAVMSRVEVRRAANRQVEAAGGFAVGADIARFGDDRTVFYKRHGLKIVDQKELYNRDTQYVARALWDFVGRDPSMPVKIDDTGVGGGVSDKLRDLGGKVIMVNFGASPRDKNKYTSVADEMWFDFPIDEADIPNDEELLDELTNRRYTYDKADRRIVEPKKKYKDRNGKSPDKADALLLCYYSGGTAFDKDFQKAMAERRRRR
jgi:phage terminase large subunit